MTAFLYSAIIITATFLGAFVGLGGGVIIKPLLDLIGRDTVDVVNFISACAVFSMSISASIKHIRAKTKINFKLILSISAGAIIGGILGSRLFDYLLTIFDNDILKSVQGFILGALLVFSVVYVNLKNAKTLHIKSYIVIAFVGVLLGFTASFLGVGGGPINVAFLIICFSMTLKEAAVYSVAAIFFSQLSKLVTMTITSSIPTVSPITVITAVICAVAGGILGAKMNKRSNEKTIKIIFSTVVTGVAAVNFYNALTIF